MIYRNTYAHGLPSATEVYQGRKYAGSGKRKRFVRWQYQDCLAVKPWDSFGNYKDSEA